MINLAGKTKADLQILEELSEADIQVIEGKRARSEVPQTITDKLANWNFERAWYYWIASVSEGSFGLPLDVATELHERKYPLIGENQPQIYGDTIRVVGHAGCPHPREWALPNKETLHKEMQRLGLEKVNYNELTELFNSGKILVPRFVNSYHIDDQEGLNAFARTIREINNVPSNINDTKHLLSLYDKISKLYSNWEAFENENQEGIEWVKKMPEILYDNGSTVNELIVAIRDEKKVVSIAKKWENKDGAGGIAQYFFDNSGISGFNLGHMSGPGDILNRGPVVDAYLRPHYNELKELRPSAALSLERCLQRLEIPGINYTGQSDGRISFRLR